MNKFAASPHQSLVKLLAVYFGIAVTFFAGSESLAQSAPRAKKESANRPTKDDPSTSLRLLLKKSRETGQYVPATNEELNDFENLLIRCLNCPTLEEAETLSADWEKLNWEFCPLPKLGGWVIIEKAGHRTGRGVYFFRLRPQGNLVLQSPHRFFDMKTGTILSGMVQHNWVSAAAWNTVHRKQIDLAHTSDHHYNVFTRTVIQRRPESLFLQLHGFAVKKKSDPLRQVKMIVSDGTKFPGRPAWYLAERFKQSIGKQQVRLYPLETKRLGGTTNAQAKVVWSEKSMHFLHLEMNAELRQQIVRDQKTRTSFADILGQLAIKTID